jgi:hypothetical protein
MAVDLTALKQISEDGSPSDRVTVSRRWLAEVHRCLKDGDDARAELKRRDEHPGSIFDQVFGSGRYRG